MAYTVGFGKHSERTLEWLFFNDPGYIWWMVKNGADQNFKGSTLARFKKLVRRAKHLAIPGPCRHCKAPITRMSVMEHPSSSGGLTRADYFCDNCHHSGSSPCLMTVPSFYTPDFFKSYDKLGGKILVDSIKWAYYGKKIRMTQAKMEDFFDTDSNFVNP